MHSNSHDVFVIRNRPCARITGAPWVQAALHESLGNFGPLFITVAMVLFAFTTLLGNCFYCDNLLNYIHKGQPSKTFMKGFRIVSALVVFIGAGMEVSMLWNISDVLMGVMALINIPVILILSNTALKALEDYEKQKKMERIQCLRLGILDWNTRRIIGARFIFLLLILTLSWYN